MAGSLNVLLVEDDVLIRDLYRETLIRSGYEVEIATNGADADKKIAAKHPDVILLDIMLPGETGLELLSRWRQVADLDPTRILILTNLAQADLAKEALDHKADGYIIKAEIQPEDLDRIIHEAMEVSD